MGYGKLTAAWLLGPIVAAVAVHGEETRWVTGRALDAQMSTPVSIAWSNTPLSHALRSLSASQHLAIVLDRRVDPGRSVQLTLSQEPLRDSLRRIAESLRLGYTQLGPVAYFGPPEVARRLRTLAALRLEEAKALGGATGRKFSRERRWQWDELAEPRQLLSELAEEAGVKVVGAERIPHDLWPAADLPPLSWLERLTLLAAEFSLSFHVDSDQQVTLVPWPESVTLTRMYPGGRDPTDLAERWSAALPETRIAADGNRVRVEGLLEEHEFIDQRLRGKAPKSPAVAAGTQVYQLSIENAALGKVVQQLGQRLNLEFRWDRAAIEAAGISLDQLISVKVQGASQDELLRAVFAGTGLTFRREQRGIAIVPAAAAAEKP